MLMNNADTKRLFETLNTLAPRPRETALLCFEDAYVGDEFPIRGIKFAAGFYAMNCRDKRLPNMAKRSKDFQRMSSSAIDLARKLGRYGLFSRMEVALDRMGQDLDSMSSVARTSIQSKNGPRVHPMGLNPHERILVHGIARIVFHHLRPKSHIPFIAFKVHNWAIGDDARSKLQKWKDILRLFQDSDLQLQKAE